MTTIHAYTATQKTVDSASKKDWKGGRAAAVNIIPSTTGAAKATALVIPELKCKLDGLALRVPVPDGSITDLVCVLSREASRDEVNEAFRSASGEERWSGIVQYTDDAIVSSDIVGNPHSLIVDGQSTMANGRMVKVLGWYDNEWGYSCRLADVVERVAQRIPAAASA